MVVVTLIFGPVAFWVLTRLSGSSHTFPTSLTGLLGDFVLLPAFNGVAVHYGLLTIYQGKMSLLIIAVLLSASFSLTYLQYRRKTTDGAAWMFDENKDFNFAGWYHFLFVVIQSFIVFLTVLHLYKQPLIWLILLGYLLTTRFVFVNTER